ncbi:MAG: TonB-dependent receptor, partial [Bacteroidota bacterium]
MKTISTFLLSMFFFSSNLTFAQSTDVTGKTVSDTNNPLSFVTVSLLKKSDSTLLKVAVSNESGTFYFENIAYGNYLLKFTNVGHEQIFISLDSIQFFYKSIDLKNIVLKKSVQSLTTHTIIAKKPMIEVKADKMIFNVESSINATGSDAFELLRKSPGVMVDNNDNISMKGKTGVKIYIDGKPTQFSSSELASFLKSINSADIEAIEMISNPSAKYDAAGNAGVINIRLKKNKKYGTNGNVTTGYTQGITPKFNESIGLNYRNKKINLFGNLGYSNGMNQNDMNIYRIQLDTLYDLRSANKHSNNNINYKAGADYFINQKNTIGFISTLNQTNGTETGNGITPIYYNPTGDYVKTLVANSNGSGNALNINNNINYRYTDTSGKEINFDADYGVYRKTGEAYQPNFYNDSAGNLIYKVINRNNMPVNINIFSAKIDVEHNWGKSKIGYGAKTSFV